MVYLNTKFKIYVSVIAFRSSHHPPAAAP